GLAFLEALYAACTARSESMDGDLYFAEKMARARIAEVRASTEVARLVRESNERSGPCRAGDRFIETGRSLAKTVRKVVFTFTCTRHRNACREAPVGT